MVNKFNDNEELEKSLIFQIDDSKKIIKKNIGEIESWNALIHEAISNLPEDVNHHEFLYLSIATEKVKQAEAILAEAASFLMLMANQREQTEESRRNYFRDNV